MATPSAAPLAERVAVVTGGRRGIGLAIATALAVAGARVALVDHDASGLDEAATTLRATSARVLTLTADVGDHAAARTGVAAVLAWAGRLDILVNNAGIAQPTPFLELSEADWDLTLDTHLKGAFNWSQAALPPMLTGGWGRIINISSMSAKHGGAYPAVSKTAYAAAKAGLLGFTAGLAREAAPHVTVNAICPGVIATGMAASITSGPAAERTLALIPLGRLGQPADVAACALFLASEAAGYITGESIDVNGGVYID